MPEVSSTGSGLDQADLARHTEQLQLTLVRLEQLVDERCRLSRHGAGALALAAPGAQRNTARARPARMPLCSTSSRRVGRMLT